jgi:hypothetical protein
MKNSKAMIVQTREIRDKGEIEVMTAMTYRWTPIDYIWYRCVF